MENKEIVQVLKESLQIQGKEDIFTDELLESLSTVFEAKILEHKQTVEDQVKVELEEANRSEIIEFKSALTDQLDEYLNYFTEKFLDDNQEQIHEDVKVKTAERVLARFNGLVNDFNIQLDESTLDQDETIDSLKEELNDAVNRKIELEEEMRIVKKQQCIQEAADDIDVSSEKATFVKLAENFDYKDEDQFKEKLTALSESVIISKKKKKKAKKRRNPRRSRSI